MKRVLWNNKSLHGQIFNTESDIDLFGSSDADEFAVFEFAAAGRYNITLHFYGNQVSLSIKISH